MQITIDTAIELLSTHNVDHGAAGAAAVPLGRAIAAFRTMDRLRLLALRNSGFKQNAEGVCIREPLPAIVSEFTPDEFDEALSLAFVPQPVLRDAARFSLARPEDNQPEQFEWDPASVIGVTFHAINATLGYRYVVGINQAAVIMRQILTAAGVDARQHDTAVGYMAGCVRGIALSSAQMRTWRSADSSLRFAEHSLSVDKSRPIIASILVMAGVMQSFNE